jgi:hypothetical protein
MQASNSTEEIERRNWLFEKLKPVALHASLAHEKSAAGLS